MSEHIFTLPPMPLQFLIIYLFLVVLFYPLIYLVTIYLPELPIRTLKRLNYLQFDGTT